MADLNDPQSAEKRIIKLKLYFIIKMLVPLISGMIDLKYELKIVRLH